MRVKPHHHPCAGCGAKTECSGTWEQNYDGMPPVICTEYRGLIRADFIASDDFVCDACAALGQCDNCGKYQQTTVHDGDALCAACLTERGGAHV